MLVKDPVEELKSTRVFSHLMAQSSEYADRAIRFVQMVAPILATTVQHFPLYTRHDAHHGFQVVRRLDNVLQPGCLEMGSKQSLGAPELFLLIAAAYAHDLGNKVVAISDSLSGPMRKTEALMLSVSEVDVGAFRALSATISLAIALAVSVGAKREKLIDGK